MNEILNVLSTNVESLMKLNSKLKQENVNLSIENEKLIAQNKEFEVENEILKEKNKIIRLASSVGDKSDGNLELKLKINEMVREIDKCIAHLNR